MNHLHPIQTIACRRMPSSITFQCCSKRLASRRAAASPFVVVWSKSCSIQRRVVGSHSLPSAQSRTVFRITTHRRSEAVVTSSPTVTSNCSTMCRSGMHSSARQEQSTTLGLEYHQVANLGSSTVVTSNPITAATTTTTASTNQFIVPSPSLGQLRDLFFTASIPFIGFGFMDNFIMIQAGGYIDATLGVQLGMATMTAAAMGQVVSDVSGVVFGGTLERFLQQWHLVKEPTLTAAQKSLSLCRNVSMAGSAFGVMLGCFLGACSLMFVDLEVHERQKNAQQLCHIVQDMMSSSQDDAGLDCDTCTIFLTKGREQRFSALHSHKEFETTTTRRLNASIQFLEHPPAGATNNNSVRTQGAWECAEQRQVMTAECDQALYAPVLSMDGSNVLAVIEFRNKRSSSFTSDDEQTAKIMARHVSIFMERL